MVLNILRWKVVSWVMFSNPLWIVIASQVTMVRFDLSYYVEVIFIICGTLYFSEIYNHRKSSSHRRKTVLGAD